MANKKQKHRSTAQLRFAAATWNIRSLVEDDGDRRNARSRPRPELRNSNSNLKVESPDRKLDLMVKEVQRVDIDIVGVQETKWFGCDVWSAADGFTFLHSGRNLPQAYDEKFVRREGVGILLNRRMTAAWKAAGESWKAVSSRVVYTRLRFVDGSRRGRDKFVSIVSAYAPTFKATPAVKGQFYSDLQSTLDSVPAADHLMVLGDFNAHVGSLDQTNDYWHGTLGKFGLGNCNEAGERFCNLHS